MKAILRIAHLRSFHPIYPIQIEEDDEKLLEFVYFSLPDGRTTTCLTDIIRPICESAPDFTLQTFAFLIFIPFSLRRAFGAMAGHHRLAAAGRRAALALGI